MSLRQDIHAALDETAPSTRGLSERIVESVATGRRRSIRWTLPVRAPLSLVAVLLLIAVVAGVLMGGRLLQDWNSSHNPAPAGEKLSPLAKLEASQLHLPTVNSTAQCVGGPLSSAGDLGSGPFHMGSSAVVVPTGWGTYRYNFLYVDRDVSGPVIVRAADLITRQRIVFIGDYAAGSTVGSDTVGGQTYRQHLELVFAGVAATQSWVFINGRPKGTSGCIGFEVDSPRLTEMWVIHDQSPKS